MRVLYLDAGAGLNLEMLCGALADLENAEPLDIGFPGAALQIETRRCAGVAGRYVQALYAPGVEDEQACDLEAAKRLLVAGVGERLEGRFLRKTGGRI